MLKINFEKLKMYLFAGLLVYALSSILFSTDGYAVFENLTKTGGEVFEGMKKIIFAAAGFGIIAVALGAVFGALNWKWLFSPLKESALRQWQEPFPNMSFTITNTPSTSQPIRLRKLWIK